MDFSSLNLLLFSFFRKSGNISKKHRISHLSSFLQHFSSSLNWSHVQLVLPLGLILLSSSSQCHLTAVLYLIHEYFPWWVLIFITWLLLVLANLHHQKKATQHYWIPVISSLVLRFIHFIFPTLSHHCWNSKILEWLVY